MKIADGFVVSQVGGKTVAVASGALCSRFNGMITLNETGVFLFRLLQNDVTEEELCRALADEYGIGPERAKADVEAFLKPLGDKGLLQ